MLTCAGCSTPILHTYIKAMRKNWHVDCFRCSECSLPIHKSAYKTKNHLPYHLACYQKKFLPICPTCGEPVMGMHIQALRHMYHPGHFICVACRKSIQSRSFHTHEGKPYCKEDFTRLFSPHCSVCNLPITGAYHLDALGNKVCSKRDRDHRMCASCGKILHSVQGTGGKRLKDGRSVCSQCLSSAINDLPEGLVLFGEVCQELQAIGIVVPYQKIPLKLVSMTELRHDYSRRSWQRTFGLTQVKETSLLGMSVTRQVSGILALNNLPRVHLGMVLAHEAMHAWLYMNNYPRLPKRVEEGLCELIASLWLARQTSPLVAHLQMNLQQNRSTIYGSGYRAAQKSFDKMGLQALLTYVRQHKTLPR